MNRVIRSQLDDRDLRVELKNTAGLLIDVLQLPTGKLVAERCIVKHRQAIVHILRVATVCD